LPQPGDGLMTGAWNVASDMETERENGPHQHGKSVADVARDFGHLPP